MDPGGTVAAAELLDFGADVMAEAGYWQRNDVANNY